jgi:hypothetical protein
MKMGGRPQAQADFAELERKLDWIQSLPI